MADIKNNEVQPEEQTEGKGAEFMGDAPGAKIQSCVPTLKTDKKEVNISIPMAPPKK